LERSGFFGLIYGELVFLFGLDGWVDGGIGILGIQAHGWDTEKDEVLCMID
jgi:hypothetical protein